MKNILTLFFLGFGLVAMAQETYTLSDESSLTIDGTSTLHDWTVTANTMTGTAKKEGAAPKEIDFEVVVADIISERGATMDKKMHDALKKEENPKVIFKLVEVKDESIFVGTLNIAGQEKTVEIPVQMEAGGSALKLTGEQKLTLQDYGMEPPTAMFGSIIVGDDVTVKFDLVFVKS